MKHVKLTIRPDGSCTVDALDFTDATCTQATAQILAALGGSISEEQHKPAAQRVPPQLNARREASR